jgi:hypothetical protein
MSAQHCNCKNDVGLDLNFGFNKYAKSAKNNERIKNAGIDYEILQGKLGYKLYYFVVKNQPCVDSYVLHLTFNYLGNDEDRKKLNEKSFKFPLEVSDEETGNSDYIILKANYNELYDDGNGVVDECDKDFNGLYNSICIIQILPDKCKGKLKGGKTKKLKVCFKKCD